MGQPLGGWSGRAGKCRASFRASFLFAWTFLGSMALRRPYREIKGLACCYRDAWETRDATMNQMSLAWSRYFTRATLCAGAPVPCEPSLSIVCPSPVDGAAYPLPMLPSLPAQQRCPH